ncbi:hypothetical protein J437_LFUL005081 [Ladona fulva]|uniref:Mitochondrial import receptor subunit TOM20 n=1 Tax=Ladona fulva TaxID=123851 RepID=A0A8K0JX20_LADFU|nr:hypothetical protein J437_LFUL005081 [Ladona fulva]
MSEFAKLIKSCYDSIHNTMTVFTMKTLGVAAAFCSTVALAYVVYEKQKRHLNEKIEKESQEPSNKYGSLGIPDFKDKFSIQKYFIEEIQLGEELLNEGKDQEAVTHFIKAIVVCTQRDKFLPVIKNKISKQAYVMLLEGLAEVNVSV